MGEEEHLGSFLGKAGRIINSTLISVIRMKGSIHAEKRYCILDKQNSCGTWLPGNTFGDQRGKDSRDDDSNYLHDCLLLLLLLLLPPLLAASSGGGGSGGVGGTSKPPLKEA